MPPVDPRATVHRDPIPPDLQHRAAAGIVAASRSLLRTGLIRHTLPVSVCCLSRHAALLVLAALPSDMTVARATEVLSESSLPTDITALGEVEVSS